MMRFVPQHILWTDSFKKIHLAYHCFQIFHSLTVLLYLSFFANSISIT
ncbi:hypothetical protein BMETH_733_0 [methanotrophic bacterial endosymbiont of Bathymodiolus sp.]|nr:hypothetical protein BMETH_733_0 [methanotrophic bacterial endosymbiont of Bathymodiolus sp.]